MDTLNFHPFHVVSRDNHWFVHNTETMAPGFRKFDKPEKAIECAVLMAFRWRLKFKLGLRDLVYQIELGPEFTL